MNPLKVVAVLVVVTLIALFFYFDLGAYLTLDRIKAEQAELSELLAQNPADARPHHCLRDRTHAAISIWHSLIPVRADRLNDRAQME